MITTEQLTAAERTLVGAIFLDSKAYYESDLGPDQFLDIRLGAVWRTVGHMLGSSNGDELDPVAVASSTVGIEPAFLSSLLLSTSITPDIANLAKVVRDEWKLRQYRGLIQLDDWISAGWSTDRIHAEIEARLGAINSRTARKFPTLRATMQQQLDRISAGEQPAQGLQTGLELERLVPGGIPLDKVTVIFGESGNFKSTVKNALIENIARSGAYVLDVSLEDSDELGALRALARTVGRPYTDLGTVDGRNSGHISDKISWSELVIQCGEVSPNIDEVLRVARAYKASHSIRAVFVDYIQLLESTSGRNDERITLSDAMRKAQLFAKREQVAVIFISQVNRALSGRETDRRPRLSDLFGSSTIEQHCKLAIGIYRPFKYHYEPNSSGTDLDRLYAEHYTNSPRFRDQYPKLVELSVQKNVVGENGIIHVEISPPTGVVLPSTFRDLLVEE